MVRKVPNAIGRLSAVEKRVVAAAAAGTVAYLTDNETVRAAVIRALACAEIDDWPVTPEGLRLRGGRIDGRIELADRKISWPLWLRSCAIPGGIDISDAQTRGLSLDGATIGGDEVLSAVFAQNAHVQGGFFLDGAKVTGAFDVNAATITGQLSANRCHFTSANGSAFFAQGLSCAGAFLHEAVVKGLFDVNSARISGQLSLVGTQFKNAGTAAILGQGMVCTDAFLDGVNVEGECDISSANIIGQLSANGAQFENLDGVAINAQGAHMGSVFMRRRTSEDGSTKNTSVSGMMSLTLARIDRDLDLDGAALCASHHAAIAANGIRIDGTLYIESGTRIDGAVLLLGAKIGSLRLAGCHIVAASPSRQRPVDAMPLQPVPATPEDHSTSVWDHYALDLSEANVGRLTMPATRETRPIGIVDLSRAKVGTFTDFSAAWPASTDRAMKRCEGRLCDEDGADADHLILDGFEYEHLDNPDGRPGQNSGSPESVVAARKRWLMAQSRDDLFESFRPQPWRQLAKVLAAQGHDEEAREIAIERRVMQRLSGGMPWFRRAVSRSLHTLADYGFSPWKTVAWSIGVIIVFAGIYWGAALKYCDSKPLCADERVFVRVLAADFVPAESNKTEAAQTLARNYPRFDPLLYSFDTFLPLLDAGSEKYWRANARTWLGTLLYYLTVIEQIIGALMVSLIVTGFTGLLTRDEK